MLIVMGTSLKVHGLKKLVKDFAKTVHASGPSPSNSGKAKSWAGKVVFVNRTPPGAEWAGIIDYHVAGETDVWVEKVIEDWKKMRPADWEMQKKLVAVDGDLNMSGTFKAGREAVIPAACVKGRSKGGFSFFTKVHVWDLIYDHGVQNRRNRAQTEKISHHSQLTWISAPQTLQCFILPLDMTCPLCRQVSDAKRHPTIAMSSPALRRGEALPSRSVNWSLKSGDYYLRPEKAKMSPR